MTRVGYRAAAIPPDVHSILFVQKKGMVWEIPLDVHSNPLVERKKKKGVPLLIVPVGKEEKKMKLSLQCL